MAENTQDAGGEGEGEGREELEKEAREVYGWVPKDEFRGRPEDWIDAPEFVDKARGVLPIVQANNRRLSREMAQVRSQAETTAAALRAAQAALRALEEDAEERGEERAEETRERLKQEIAAASREGEHDKVAELTDQLIKVGQAKPKERSNGEDTQDGGGPRIPPALQREITDWYADNPEYRTGRKAALSHAISLEFRANGDERKGAEFLDAVAEEVEKALGGGGGGGHSRVAGDTGGRRRSSPAGGGKTYADLPAEAKAACDRMAPRVVGAGKKHKDIGSWRASYVKQYYE